MAITFSVLKEVVLLAEWQHLVNELFIVDFSESLSGQFKEPVEGDKVLDHDLNTQRVLEGPWLKLARLVPTSPHHVELKRPPIHAVHKVVHSLGIGLQSSQDEQS